jgi:hypothetical protein
MRDDILQEISRYVGPKTLPPISMKAYGLYTEGGNALSTEAIEVLRTDVRAEYGDLARLTDAVIGLGVFGVYLKDTLHDPIAAKSVARLIRETAPRYAPIGARILRALQDSRDQARRAFERFSNGGLRR